MNEDLYLEEIETINHFLDFELIQYLQENLISHATGDRIDNDIFQYLRKEILQKRKIIKFLPKWYFRLRTIDQYWGFIKAQSGTYAERRTFLWNEFSEILDYLESKIESPLVEELIFDESNINSQWQKAIERKNTDPEAAITIARTLIETVLKHILDEQQIEYKDGVELPELYKIVAKSLNLAPEQHQEGIFKQILGGASSIVSGLGAVRNKLGDAHGKSKKSIKPSERHSELAVNLAGSMAMFLFKTYNEAKK